MEKGRSWELKKIMLRIFILFLSLWKFNCWKSFVAGKSQHFPCAIITSYECRKIIWEISKYCHFPYFSSAKWKRFFIVRQLKRRTWKNRSAIFCFHDFFSLWSVMLAFSRMKKCKIKLHWDAMYIKRRVFMD